MPIDRRIPVVLLTGFLGSGKTSLLSRLLLQPAMQGSAVLINEFGEIGLDHWLVEPFAEDVCLLASGCLCCAVRGDLGRSLRELFMRRLRREIRALDRVFIETTGLADPAPVIHTLTQDFFLAERFRLEGVVTTLAVPQGPAQLASHEEATRQIVLADRIVLTQCDLAKEGEIASLRERVRGLNPLAEIRESGLDSTVEGLMADLGGFSLEGKSEVAKAAMVAEERRVLDSIWASGRIGGEALPARHDETVSTHLLRFERPFAWGDFVAAIEALQADCGDRILRIKGFVAVENEAAPRVFQAVGHLRYPVESLPAWPDEDRASGLVFIVRDLPKARLEAAFGS